MPEAKTQRPKCGDLLMSQADIAAPLELLGEEWPGSRIENRVRLPKTQ
jgi:hypothetical protein